MSNNSNPGIDTGITVTNGPIWEQIGISTYPDKTPITDQQIKEVKSRIQSVLQKNEQSIQSTITYGDIYVHRNPSIDFRLDLYVLHTVDMLPVQELANLTKEYQAKVNTGWDLRVSSHRIVSESFADQLQLE